MDGDTGHVCRRLELVRWPSDRDGFGGAPDPLNGQADLYCRVVHSLESEWKKIIYYFIEWHFNSMTLTLVRWIIQVHLTLTLKKLGGGGGAESAPPPPPQI